MSKDTLQLPKTSFSMKASLPTKEPEILKKWEKNKIFDNLRKKSKMAECILKVKLFHFCFSDSIPNLNR